MTVDPTVIPGLLLLALELAVLAVVGFVVARVALGQADDAMALAQGMVIGLALWGLIVNFVMYAVPGLAGAITGWAITLALGAGLAWRGWAGLRLSSRTLAGFVAAALAFFGIALAARQTLSIPDVATHLGLAASIRFGEHPPTLPWNPDHAVAYHYGVDLLIGLLTPPFGPDLAFVTELLGAYVWTSFALAVATALLQRASLLIVLVLVPLLTTAGAWTLVGVTPPNILQIPIPSGLPDAGLRTSLASVYWPDVSLPWQTEFDASPPNVWKPAFVLAYALAVVALERIAAGCGRYWMRGLTLAALLAFMGLVDETVAPVVLGLWMFLEVIHFVQFRHEGSPRWRVALRLASGPALAALLLAVSGGVITDALFGWSSSGLSLGWIDDAGTRRSVGAIDSLPGGIGLLGSGPLVAAVVAILLAWRQRLVLAFAAGSGVLLLAAFALQYPLAPYALTRFDGHAGNFALLAILLALSERLHGLRPRLRYTAAALIFALVTWPTAVEPARGIALALSRGVQVANTRSEQGEVGASLRNALKNPGGCGGAYAHG